MADEPKGVEELIKAAIARGEFNDLPGAGEPLDLNEYFRTPEEVRMGYSILRGGGYVPEEVQILKDIEVLRDELKNCPDAGRREEINKSVRDKRLVYSLLTERAKRGKS